MKLHAVVFLALFTLACNKSSESKPEAASESKPEVATETLSEVCQKAAVCCAKGAALVGDNPALTCSMAKTDAECTELMSSYIDAVKLAGVPAPAECQ